MNIYTVDVVLQHPQKGEQLRLTWLFDQQPTASMILKAFRADPNMIRRSEFLQYERALTLGLNAYGVPVLPIPSGMEDSDGTPVVVASAHCKWYMNLLGKQQGYHIDVEMGAIRVTLRPLHQEAPVIEPIVAATTPKRKGQK